MDTKLGLSTSLRIGCSSFFSIGVTVFKVKSLNATDSAGRVVFHLTFTKAESGLYTVT